MTGLDASPWRESQSPRPGAATLAVAAAGLWLLSRPFTFKETDGQVYALLALARRDPAGLGQDLFIQFGSQDAFSIFSRIYGALIGVLGLTHATMALLLIGGGFWLWGCRRLLSAMMPAPRDGLALVALAGLHVAYGGFSSLTLGEGVLTGRIFAEAFVLMGLAEVARDRWLRSAPLLLFAAAVHPLMGLAGLAVATVGEAWRRPWLWALPILGVAAAAALATAGLAPFDRLFVRMDGPWLFATRHRNGFVFIGSWTAKEWAALFSQTAATGLAAWRSSGWRRRFLAATVVCALAGVAVSWIGGDGLHSALVIQLQLWRLAWLLAWASIAAVFLLAPSGRDPAAWVVPALLAASLLPGQDWPAAGLAAIGLAGGLLRRPIEPRFAKLILAVVGFFAGLFVLEILAFYALSWPSFSRERYTEYLTVDAQKTLAWLLALPVLWLIVRRPRAGVAAAVILLLIGAGLWDRRSPWQAYVMAGQAPVSAPGPVLWGGDAAPSWFLLHAPAYVTVQQGAGLLFSRRTAEVWEARVPVTRGIMAPTAWSAHEAMQTCAKADPVFTAEDLRGICAAPDAPRAVVLHFPIAGVGGQAFTAPADETVPCKTGDDLRILHRRQFYLYACRR